MHEQNERAGGWLSSSAATFAGRVVILIALVGVAALLLQLTGLFLLLFAAIVLAVVFDAMARLIRRITRLPRGWSLTLGILLLLGAFIGVFVLFGTQLAQEFETIREQFPKALAAIEAQLNTWGLGERLRSVISSGSSDISSIMSRAGGYVVSVGSGLADFALVLVGAIFLATQPDVYRRGFLYLIPERAEPTAEKAMDDATAALRGWMVGQLMSMSVVAALTWVGLLLLGVPAAGGLGLIAGLLDIIPFVGPIIAAVPAVILAFTVSPMTAVWTMALFLLVQQIQGNVLQPLIQKHAVDVPPAVLLFAVVGAGTLFGFLGVLLAAPITVVTYVLIQRVYVQTILAKPIRIAVEDDVVEDKVKG